MLENGLWNSPFTTQDSGFVVATTCWNCGAEGHKSDELIPTKVLIATKLRIKLLIPTKTM